MGTPEIDLNALAAELNSAEVHEVADFIGFLRSKAIAAKQGLPYQTYLKRIIHEALEREDI